LSRFLAALLFSLLSLPALASWERFFTLSLGDMQAELRDARAAGKKGIVFIYQQDPCPYCERMKENILARPDVQKWYAERFAAFSIDIRGSIELVDFQGRKTTEGRYAREALVHGAPAMDFYDTSGRLLARVPGEVTDWKTFLALGDWVASGAHEKQTFEQFRVARGLDATPLKINVFKP
jgi:thioredoxin-related protein